MNWIRQHRRLALGLGAGTMYLAMLTLELTQEDDLTIVDVLQEMVMLALLIGTTVSSALLVPRMRAQEERASDFRRELASVKALGEQWRVEMAEHVRELGSAIQRQFAAWGLTPSEQDVGLLLLKGFSHKEIARLRNTSEATIRQQAASVYQKSGLTGRTGLSAYFLEELMLPDPASQFTRAAE